MSMNVLAFEGIVEKGQIKLKENVQLPDKARVYVVLPEFETEKVAHIFSPRFANPAQASDFKMEVIE